MNKKVIVITGGTSGIGEATVKALLEKDCTIYELSRRLEGTIFGVTHISTDITNSDQVKNAVSFILEKEGRIDVLINNAGYGISGAIEFTPMEEAKKQFDVNFFGMVNMNQMVIPVMRKQKSGTIINIASVASDVAIPFQAFYSASKAAVKSYSLALLNELHSFDVKVSVVLPGDIKTGFTSARNKIEAGDEEYNGMISRSVAVMEHDEQTGMNPDILGEFIAKICFKKNPAPIYTVGIKYKFFEFLLHILSTKTVSFIVRMMYAK